MFVAVKKIYSLFHSRFSFDWAWEKCFLGQCVFRDTALPSVFFCPFNDITLANSTTTIF